jgi:CRISPR-associated endonuclease/helicase Cas3
MVEVESYVGAYWGKARPSNREGPDWHPLAYHSLDVAAAMKAILAIRPRWLESISQLSGLSRREARRRLVLAAALHDLGKFAENFQGKAPEVFAKLQRQGVTKINNTGHGDVGHQFWADLMYGPRRAELVSLEPWLLAAVAHHGAPTRANLVLAEAMSKTARTAATDFLDAMFVLLGRPTPDRVSSRAETWRVAGLVMLADWIGSNQTWFRYRDPDLALDAYWREARKCAARAVGEAELAEATAATSFDLTDLLPNSDGASPLQTWAARETVPLEPTLYVIEDLTGSGKTEAALILAHRLMAAGRAEGVYWALPTMATANGLYRRLEGRYQAMFARPGPKPSLVLAHGGRDLNSTFQASIGPGKHARYGDGVGEQNLSGEAHCAAFIAEDRKKTFLAQVGVGTLDQALLAVLPVRHQALRLATLSRRVLVIDEAHAYDPYMTAALERLLQFQAALGGSAIVLSATLTGEQRRKFAAAYNGGATASLAETTFPLISRASVGGCLEAPQEATRGARRDLPVRRQPSPEAAMEALLAAAAEGRCGVYIRNTVKDAIDAVAWLRAQAGPGVTIDLFHARFALGDRLARETEALERFGVSSTEPDRRGRILVATQVVEQSLDLDFDYMATDLCPMDLLIQRAGRLHRHGHRPLRPAPMLDVVSAEATAEPAADWYAALFPTGQYVYPDVGQLWRTQGLLQEFGGLPLKSRSPRDLIEPVFGDSAFEVPDALKAASDRALGKGLAARAISRQNVLKTKDFSRGGGAWDSDIRTPTRLSEPSVVIRLARWEGGVLSPWFADADPYRAWRLSEVTLRISQFQSAVMPDQACGKAAEATQASWPGRFDPPPILPLTPTRTSEQWAGKLEDGRSRSRSVAYATDSGLVI